MPAAPNFRGELMRSILSGGLLRLAALLTCFLLLAGCSSGGSNQPGPDDADAPTEFSETDSGLQYRILRKSTGPHPNIMDRVTVHYRGWLDDGKEFDSSYKKGAPITFPLTGVIPGWTEGLQLVGEGGKIELLIPPKLGYGRRGSPGGVPPNATLHFIVELQKIK
jgi:FKBP-type peptidyl-prolyl cis-trans isomerase